MPVQRFLIAPPTGGLVNNVKPWLIPDDAFSDLNNAYVFRGRVKKRFGSTVVDANGSGDILKTRLRINIGTTDPITGNFVGNVPGILFIEGQAFSIGSTVFTVYQNGAMYSTGAATGTYNTGTGAVSITGNNENPSTAVYFYSATPVLALAKYEQITTNREETIAYDQQFAYRYSNGWERITGGADTWSTAIDDLYWTLNYRGPDPDDRYFFVVNGNISNGIRYYDGATFTQIAPVIRDSGDTLLTARLLLSFQGRMLALNTTEFTVATGATENFKNRVRWCQLGNPIENAPAVDAAWNENSPAKGGSLDAPTTQAIITASIIKNRLLVYFEQSTYELVYTNNQVAPFIWQSIDEDLGASGTFTIVSFDKQDLVIGNVGIIGCNGVVVERIDANVPDEVFNILANEDGFNQAYGVRDFFSEQVYWSIPDIENSPLYPNKILVYNYVNATWAFFDDIVTAFGLFQQSTNNYLRQVIAGNQQGYTWMVDRDESTNEQAFFIFDISVAGSLVTIKSYDHNLYGGEFIQIQNVTGLTGLNGNIYKVTRVDFESFTITQAGTAGTYTGGGTYSLVSRIDIKTKQYNFFLSEGQNLSNYKIDFFVDRTSSGALTIDYFASASNQSLLADGIANGSIIGTGVLETAAYATIPFEATQDRIWHSIFPQVNGESIQLRIYSSDAQMTNPDTVLQPFELHGMLFYVQTTSFRLQ